MKFQAIKVLGERKLSKNFVTCTEYFRPVKVKIIMGITMLN